jgi:hypothetical protein
MPVAEISQIAADRSHERPGVEMFGIEPDQDAAGHRIRTHVVDAEVSRHAVHESRCEHVLAAQIRDPEADAAGYGSGHGGD